MRRALSFFFASFSSSICGMSRALNHSGTVPCCLPQTAASAVGCSTAAMYKRKHSSTSADATLVIASIMLAPGAGAYHLQSVPYDAGCWLPQRIQHEWSYDK